MIKARWLIQPLLIPPAASLVAEGVSDGADKKPGVSLTASDARG